ncbi:MAG: MATE family efflux transporter [Myxococcota bacterium]|nr:MATE family efflux transporter [Myxococcota bacterium]
MVVTGLLKCCYFMTDSFWVGKLGPEALAALGGSAFAWWITVQLTDLAGTGVHSLAAQQEGAARRDEIPSTAAQGLWAGAVVALVLLVVWPFRDHYFILLGFEAGTKSFTMGSAYLGASLLGAGTLVLHGVVTAAFRGLGDTRTGMWIAAVAALLNLGLDPLLIWGWGPIPALSIAGAAWATCLANAIGSVIGVVVLAKRGLVLVPVRPVLEPILKIVRIGLPITAAGVGFSFIYVLLGRFINDFGEHHMAALGIGHRLEGMAFMVTVGFMVGAATMVGQYVGAGDFDGARRCARTSARMCCLIMVPMSVLLFLFAEPLFSIFTKESSIIDSGVVYLRIQTVVFVFMALEIVYEGAFTGTADTLPTLWVTGIGTAARIPLAWFLAYHCDWGIDGVWYAIALTTLVKGIVMMLWFKRGHWARKLEAEAGGATG